MSFIFCKRIYTSTKTFFKVKVFKQQLYEEKDFVNENESNISSQEQILEKNINVNKKQN